MGLQTPSQIVRRYLPQLARRVHPDLFAQNPTAQSTNLTSLQNLNALVSQVFPANSTNNQTPTKHYPDQDQGNDLQLVFYCRTLGSPASESPPLLIKHTLTGRKIDSTTTCISPVLLRTLSPTAKSNISAPLLAASFLALCQKAGIQVSSEDLDLLRGCVETALGGKMRGSIKRATKNAEDTNRTELRQEFSQAVREGIGGVDTTRDKMKHRSAPSKSPPMPRFIFYHSSLSSDERATAGSALMSLPSATLAGIRDIPVLIARRYAVHKDGVLIIPWDFSVETLDAFLEVEGAEVRRKFSRRAA
ncbi:uncharacterized protein SPPG_01791 [Spizellomyces punctatus DAOM BR117]|uniref:DUF4460 domain-containing protein n=1 Tax=Spizellomyces punctatus (strain DAOM BR117) TaxID=645134 RepID=A0A0L0HNS4_SPIPD|nr:uncharacterized protein SPPG_01791 [Spizellomyces punctatus DAOM BR117]KND02708.1 hypothetical protein SPPG_01791 [Spizellomyces punctatus DAOM BR117]|eukprot:XP_016610747.1 hypothetical protein SPPG_01791 [Spizellomyces punctatus DAOM BR117]